MPKSKQFVIDIVTIMYGLFQDYPLTELVYETPFQLLVAVLLSAQTTDKQVNKTTQNLFKHLKNPADGVRLWEESIKGMIKTIGLYNTKAKNIALLSQQLLDYTPMHDHQNSPENTERKIWRISWKTGYAHGNEVYADRWYRIPDSVEELSKLAWVWTKTAKVVAYVLYRKRVVAVDTHVHRVMNRLGVVNTKYPEQTSLALEKKIPDDYKDIAHRVIIYFGRYVCTAQRPQCSTCPLFKQCTWWKRYLRKL
jgi:endonuclease-3